MQTKPARVVVLGMGGTIAGVSPTVDDSQPYVAAQLGIAELLARVPAIAGTEVESEQVAQLDSKDMTHEAWRRLVERARFHLARPEVAGLVVTHGTDTLEETAYLLHRVVAANKPVVITGAMRPASSANADGPGNLVDAIAVAREPGARGVVAVMAGQVHTGAAVRKVHTSRIDAFASGEGGPIAGIQEGRVTMRERWPAAEPLQVELPPVGAAWPRVAIVISHAGVDGAGVDAAVAHGTQGLVVAGTGSGTVHDALNDALLRAQAAGVRVMRATRVPEGSVANRTGDPFAPAGELSPVKARIELMLQLMRA